MSVPYQLYGTHFSLYTGKVRSYLLKKDLEFVEVLSTVRIYKNFIIPNTGVKYIPVVKTPDNKVLQDTTVIIDELEQRHPDISVYPESPKQKLVSLLLESYGDEWLVIPAMHYRWSFPDHNQPFVFQNFGLVVAPKAPKFIRAWLGKKLGGRFKSMLPSLGITEAMMPAIEDSFMQLLDDLECHFSKHDFLLGGRPSIADFGFIGPFHAHLYLDPYPAKLLREKAPSVVRWIVRMTTAQRMSGDFVENDEIPETLLPILQRMSAEQIPVLLDTDRQLSLWRTSNLGSAIPRSLGKHKFRIDSVIGERIMIPYSLWMFERPYRYYQSLSNAEKQEMQTLLIELGLIDALEKCLENNLTRINNKLVFAE